MNAIICWNCGGDLDDIPHPISRHATCSHCFNELHCCRLCRHFDEKRTMQCFEDRADPPLQKENANFCDFFAPSNKAYVSKTTDKSDSAKSQLASLFGEEKGAEEQLGEEEISEVDENTTTNKQNQQLEKPAPSKEDIAKQKLDDLFS